MNYLKRAIELYKKGKLLEQSSINLKFEKEIILFTSSGLFEKHPR